MAGTQLADAYVQIVPSMKGVQGEIARGFGGAGGPLDKEAGKVGKRSGGLLGKGLGAGLLAGAGPLVGIAAAGLGVAKLTGYVTDSIAAVANWEAINAQTASVVKATGGAAQVSAQHVNELANSLEGSTSTQAEAIQEGANLLLTFKGVQNAAGKGNDVFDQTTKAAVDMARAMGTDVKGAALQLGKALNDPEKGLTKLSRSGVTFTDQQKAQVKALQASGDTLGAQKIILAELNGEFGGSGAAYAKTYSGQLYQLQDAVGDFGEEIATAAMPALTALVGTASKVVKWAGSLELGSKAASGIGTVMSAIGPPVKAALDTIGAAFGDIGKSAGPGVAGVGAAFKPLLPIITGLVPQVVTLFTAFNPLGLVLRSLLPVIPQLLPPILQLATALGGALTQVLGAVVPLIIQLAGVFISVGTTLAGALIPVLSTLVTALLPVFSSVIATLVPVIAQLATTLGSTLATTVTALLPVITSVIGVIAGLIPVLVPLIAQVLQLAAGVIAQLIPALLPLVSAVLPLVASLLAALLPVIVPLVTILGTVLAGVIRALLPLITTVFSAIVPIITAAVGIITGVLNVVVGLLTGNFTQVFQGLGQVVSGAFNLVVSVIGGAVSIIGAAIGAIVNIVIAVFGGIVALIAVRAKAAVDVVVSLFRGAISLIVRVVTAIVTGVVAVWNGLVGLVGAAIRLVVNVVTAVFTAYITVVRTVILSIVKAIVAVWNTAVGFVRAVIDRVVAIVTAVFTAYISVVRTVVTSIVTGIVTVWNTAVGLVRAVIDRVVTAVTTVFGGAVGTVKGAVTKVVDGITSTVRGVVDTVTRIGSDIVNGLVSGVRGGFDFVIGAARDLANLLPEWVQKVLDIHSPSRVMLALGRFVGQGFVKGIAGTQDQVKSAADSLVAKVTDAFTKLGDNREAAQKRLVKLDRDLIASGKAVAAARIKVGDAKDGKAKAAAQRSLDSATNRRKGLLESRAEQRAIVADGAKLPKGPARKALFTSINDENKTLIALAGTRERLAGSLKDAQDNLTSAVKIRDDFRDSVQQTTIALGDVVASFKTVVDARAKAVDAITSLQDKLTGLADGQTSAAKDVLAAQGDIDKNARDIASTQADAAKNQAEINRLSAYGSDYSEKLSDLQDKAADFAGKLADLDATRGELGTKLGDQMAKVADYAAQAATAQNDLAKAQTESVQKSTPAILQTLRQAVTDTNTFQSVLQQLRGQGLDQTTYSQLVTAGVANGGLAAAQELLGAGSGVVREVATLQTQLGIAGAALGLNTSTVLYQAGVDTAQASVDGIKAKIVDNQAAIGLMQAALASSISALGISTKPLMRGVGADVAAGFADGIRGSASDLDKVVAKLGRSVVKRLRKSLDSHSPSRATRAVGADTGLGFQLGIEDTFADVERASTNLAAIPTAALGDVGLDLGTAPVPVFQTFTGPMGYTQDEVADRIATKTRRAVTGASIPRVRVG